MINALILTNLEEGCSREYTSEHLQLIQKVAGKVNFRIVKAIVDCTGGTMPYFEQVLNSLKHCTKEYDVIILDDTNGLSDTEAYDTLKGFMDDMNIPVYFYQYEELFLPDDNDKFDYSDEPFEVCELRFEDDISSIFGDVNVFEESLNAYWEIIANRCETLSIDERCERKLNVLNDLNKMVTILMHLVSEISDNVDCEVALYNGTL